MKANRAARAAHPDDGGEAVSSVVAAILLFALFTTAFTLWTVTTLPQWIAEREQQHSRSVQQSFAALSSGLDALSAADDTGPSAVPVDLGAEPVALLQTAPSSGELGVQDTITAQATFTGEALHFADGSAVGQPDEAVDEGAGDVVADVQVLQALVVRLSTSNVGNDESGWLLVEAADAAGGTVTGALVHAGKLGGSGANEAGCLNSELRLEVTVDLPSLTPYTSTQALLCELSDDLAGYSVDLASNLYAFADGLDRLEAPFTLTLTDDDDGGGSTSADGYFAAAYVDSDGLAQGVGSGEAVDYQLDQQGKRLRFEPTYQEYADQEVSWEFGAMVVMQGEDGVVLGPTFHLDTEDGQGALSWTLVETLGSGSHAGRGQATARVEHDRTTDLVLTADGAAFTLTTPSAAAWRSFWSTQVLLADAGADVAVGGTGDTATLTLSSASVSQWRVHLRVVQAHVTVA